MPFMNLPSSNDQTLFLKALDRFKVTEIELNNAFWNAYADTYVPSSGIEFRHLYKHIEKERHGSGDRLYSYKEMLNIVDKEKITTEHFEIVEKDKWRRG